MQYFSKDKPCGRFGYNRSHLKMTSRRRLNPFRQAVSHITPPIEWAIYYADLAETRISIFKSEDSEYPLEPFWGKKGLATFA